MRITFNPLAFFFGPIYFAVKGMWRKGLMLFGLTLVFNALLLALNVPSSFDMAIACGVGALYATTANYAWYLHVRNDNRSWNIFEGTTRSKLSRDRLTVAGWPSRVTGGAVVSR